MVAREEILGGEGKRGAAARSSSAWVVVGSREWTIIVVPMISQSVCLAVGRSMVLRTTHTAVGSQRVLYDAYAAKNRLAALLAEVGKARYSWCT